MNWKVNPPPPLQKGTIGRWTQNDGTSKQQISYITDNWHTHIPTLVSSVEIFTSLVTQTVVFVGFAFVHVCKSVGNGHVSLLHITFVFRRPIKCIDIEYKCTFTYVLIFLTVLVKKILRHMLFQTILFSKGVCPFFNKLRSITLLNLDCIMPSLVDIKLRGMHVKRVF